MKTNDTFSSFIYILTTRYGMKEKDAIKLALYFPNTYDDMKLIESFGEKFISEHDPSWFSNVQSSKRQEPTLYTRIHCTRNMPVSTLALKRK